MSDLSLLVLTRDAQKVVEDNLIKIYGYLEGCRGVDAFEVIVCDHSADSTPEIVRRMESGAPWLRYCAAGRPGIGAGIKAGIERSKMEYAMTYPIDMAWDMRVIGESVAALDAGADLVFGSRYAEGSRVRRPLRRRLASLGYRVAVQVAFGLGIRDLNGTLAFKTPLVKKFSGGLRSDTAFLPTEMAVSARELGAQIREIPSDVLDLRNNNMGVIAGHTRDMLKDMLAKKLKR